MSSGGRNTVLVAGYYGFHNLGDEMILAGLTASLWRIEPGLRIVVVSGDPEETRRRHGVEAVLWTDLDAIAHAVSESRLVILGGGGLFHDKHDFQLNLSHLLTPNHAGLTFYTGICLMARLSGVPFLLAGVGVGPLESHTARDLTAWCFQHAVAATVRDQHSLDQLVRLQALESDGVGVGADLALLNLEWPLGEETSKPDQGVERLVVIPRSWALGGGQPDWESALAEALAQVRVDEIVFLPFQSQGVGGLVNDEFICHRIKAHPALSKQQMQIEPPPLTVDRAGGILASCTAVIGMRYHGVLEALLAGKPVMAMAYDPKVSALMGEVGLDEWVLSPGQWNPASIGQCLKALLERRPTISPDRLEKLRHRASLTLKQVEMALAAKPQTHSTDRFLVETLLDARAELDSSMAAHFAANERHDQIAALLGETENQLKAQQQQTSELALQLQQIHASRYWRAMGWYWSLRHTAGRALRRLRRAGRRILSLLLPGVWNRGLVLGTADRKPPRWEDWGLPPAGKGKVDILFFPIIDWDFRFQRPQQLARGLAAQGHRIFYLETTFGARKIAYEELEKGVYQIQLPGSGGASIYRDAPTEKDLTAHTRAMDQLAHAAGVAEAVCLVQLPYWGPLALELRRLQGWKVAYDCLDDHGGFSTNAPEMLELEKDLLEKSDLVLASSERLYQRNQKANSKVQLLANAADVAHFAPAAAKLSPPPDFPPVGGPVIGYFGAISEWFDFELLRHAVEQLPDALFYLIGDTWGSDEHGDLAARSNVIFAGEKPYKALPSYLAQFDVCLIPFKDLRLTQATDPVKLYEYLAAGKPVVARDLPELRKFGSLIHLSNNSQGFTQAILKALETTGAVDSATRQRLVAGHNWAERVGRLRVWLEDLFQPVSLVIPVWNQLGQSRECLTSLLETTQHPKLELIVVDNASDGPTAGYLSQLPIQDERFKVIRLEENVGFGPAVNAGIREAGGEVLGILNNDIILTRGWLSRLLGHLDRDPSIGMIGPVTNNVGNEARLPFDYTNRERLEIFASQVAHLYGGRSAPIPMLAMFCALMPRSVYQQVGELDERFSVGMFEDDDYAIRLRQAGYRPACARDVFIHHHGQASFGQLGQLRYRAIFLTNQKVFESKWGILWDGHSHQGLDDYERAGLSLSKMIGPGACSLIVVPTAANDANKAQQTQIQSLRQSDKAVAYWGMDGKVTVDFGQETLSDLPWVALDRIASPALVSFGQTPLEEIRLRLRAAHIQQAQSGREQQQDTAAERRQ